MKNGGEKKKTKQRKEKKIDLIKSNGDDDDIG